MKLEIKEFKVHWSVEGIRTFAPQYRTYKGINITEDDVREMHIKLIVDEYIKSPIGYNWFVYPKNIHIHSIEDITQKLTD